MTHTRKLLIVSLLAVSLFGSLAVAPAAAANNSTATATLTDVPQSPTTTPAPTETPAQTPDGPDGGPNETVLTLDESVAVTDWWYDHDSNEFVISFYADEYTAVTLVGSPDSEAESGTLDFKGRALDKGKVSVVRIQSETGVSFWTEKSAEDGRAGFLRAPQDNPLGGPYDDQDVRNAAIGGSLGVALAVIFEAVAAKLAATDSVERVA